MEVGRGLSLTSNEKLMVESRGDEVSRRWQISRRIIVAVFVLVYTAVLLGNAATRSPWVDEIYVSNPAWNFVNHGSFGTSNFEMSNTTWTRVDKTTYNTFPLGILNLAAWYKLFGLSLITTRLPSLFWGGVLLGAIYFLSLGLNGDRRLAILSVFLLSIDYNFMIAATFGRLDMMCSALGFSALATYCNLSVRRPRLAILLSFALAALSLFTHPNGIVFVLGLPVVARVMFRKPFNWRYVLLASIPLLVAGGCWLLFLSRDWHAASDQLADNARASSRLIAFKHPASAIYDEITRRYFDAYGLALGEHPSGPVRARAVILIVYLGALITGIVLPSIRRSRWAQVMLSLWVVISIYLTFFEGTRFTYYVLNITPIYCALLAAAVLYLSHKSRIIAVLLCVGLALLQMGGVVYRSLQNPYRNNYLPAVSFLKLTASPDDLVFANGDFALGYGFDRNVKEEMSLGYRSGVRPRYIVIDANIVGLLKGWKAKEPARYAFMIHRIESYKEIYNYHGYRILAAPEAE